MKIKAAMIMVLCAVLVLGGCSNGYTNEAELAVKNSSSDATSKVESTSKRISVSGTSSDVKAANALNQSLQMILTNIVQQLEEQESFQQLLVSIEQKKLSIFTEDQLNQIQMNRKANAEIAYGISLDLNLIINQLVVMNSNGETLTPLQVIQIEKLVKSYESEIQSVLEKITTMINEMGINKTKKAITDYSYDSIVDMQAAQFDMLNDVETFTNDLMDILGIDPETASMVAPNQDSGNSSATKIDFSLIRPTDKVRVGKDFVVSGLNSLAVDDLVNDPGYKSQWYLAYTNSNLAWSQLQEKEPIRIAIIDTGIDYTHPDLLGRVNYDEGYDFVNNDEDAMDDNGHGTHVAGIIGATSNNGIGISGTVGPLNIELIPIKVLNQDGVGSSSSIVDGIYYAIEKNVAIINLSVGTNVENKALSDALQAAKDAGISVIVAAGNESDNCDSSPIVSSEATYTIVALTPLNKPAQFSNYGEYVDAAAPGKKIISTVPNGQYEAWDGTSMATPIVSGIVAMMLSVNPSLTPNEVYEILNTSSNDLLSVGFDVETGYGLVNAVKALEMASN